MKITIYESRQVELSLPAYFRKKGNNLTNWYVAVSEDGSMCTSNGTNGNFESVRQDAWLNESFEPCTDAEFFEALATNTDAIISNQLSVAKKWGLITLNLEAYAD